MGRTDSDESPDGLGVFPEMTADFPTDLYTELTDVDPAAARKTRTSSTIAAWIR